MSVVGRLKKLFGVEPSVPPIDHERLRQLRQQDEMVEGVRQRSQEVRAKADRIEEFIRKVRDGGDLSH